MIHPILRRYWPPESQIQLLTVALGQPEDAERAWRAWAAGNNLDDGSWAEIRLLSTLARRLRELDPDLPWLKRLESIRRFVWTRTQLNVNAARPFLARLNEAGIRMVLLKGAARLALDPKSAADRMLGDIDVLIHPEDWPATLAIANETGWRSPRWPTLTPGLFPEHHSIMVRNRTGGTVDLHHLALFVCRNFGDDDGLWQRTRPATFRGLELLAPSPADEVLIAVAHGLLYEPSPVADWALDIAPLIRSGDIDWTVVDTESANREIDPYVASGLLLASERLNLPVPQAMLDRMIARVREPFITDFRNFATCHVPSDPWVVDRVKAAAALRALRTARRTRSPADPTAAVTGATGTSGLGDLPATAHHPYISDKPISFPVPTGLPAEAHLTLRVSFDIDESAVGTRPILVIAAPGLVLKRWTASAVQRSGSVAVEMPAALLSLRRIERIGLRACGSPVGAPFTNVTLSWSTLGIPSTVRKISQFFDAAWYLRKQAPLASGAVEPLWDYLEGGWREGRNPSPALDANLYLRFDPDVAQAGRNPLLHYLRHPLLLHYLRHRLPRCWRARRRYVLDRQLVDESGLFDADFYRAEYPEILISDLEPLDEFMSGGWRGRRSPGPRFDSDWYLNHNPDVAAADINPLVHYLRHGKAEGRLPQGLAPRIVDAIRKAAPSLIRAEPQLHALAALRNPGSVVANDALHHRRLTVLGAFFQTLERAYDRLIFIPWLSQGSSDLLAMLVAKLAVESHGPHSVLLVTTELDQQRAEDRLPPGADLRVLSSFDPNLTEDDRARFVAALVQMLRPKAVLNINSRACWDAYKRFGKSLTKSSDLYAMLFGWDFDQQGQTAGYTDTHFRECLAHLKRVYCDSEWFSRELAMKFGLTEKARSKLVNIRPPLGGEVTEWVRPPIQTEREFSVLWAGRWSQEKNIELLIEICRFAPDMEFHIFGAGSDDYGRLLRQAQTDLDNLIVEGEYSSFEALQIRSHDAFLHTSLRGGIPRTLVSAGASGMPVVAPDLRGICELIDDATGWLVRDVGDAPSYVNALLEIREAPAEADRRRRHLMERVGRTHNWHKFRESLATEPGFIGL